METLLFLFCSTEIWRLTCPSYMASQSSSVQSLSHVLLSVTPWTAARQPSLSITNSRSLLKLMSVELVMPSIWPSHPLLSCPLLLPSIFPSIRVFSNESALRISSVQFSHSVMSSSLWPHGLQHARLPCSSPTPGAPGSFQMSQYITSGDQSIGVSASASSFQWTFRTDFL